MEKCPICFLPNPLSNPYCFCKIEFDIRSGQWVPAQADTTDHVKAVLYGHDVKTTK